MRAEASGMHQEEVAAEAGDLTNPMWQSPQLDPA